MPDIDLDCLYRSHARRLLAWARMRGVPPSECEDWVQELFLQAHRGRSQFRGDSTAAHWLFRIAERMSGQRQRKAYARWKAGSQEPLCELPFEGLSPLDGAELHELISLIHRALKIAGEGCGEIVLAHALDWPAPGAKPAGSRGPMSNADYVRLHRARKRLLDVVARERGDESALPCPPTIGRAQSSEHVAERGACEKPDVCAD